MIQNNDDDDAIDGDDVDDDDDDDVDEDDIDDDDDPWVQVAQSKGHKWSRLLQLQSLNISAIMVDQSTYYYNDIIKYFMYSWFWS